MTYTIKTYNNSPVASIIDGTVDTTLAIKLIGKNYPGYGQAQNENFVYLLENFASSNPPKAITGQIWFDSGTKKLKFYDGSKFRSTGGAEVAPETQQPTGLTEGDFWWDTTNKQLKVWYPASGSTPAGFQLIGPQSTSSSATEMRLVKVTDAQSQSHNISAAYVDNNVVFVVSTDNLFTLSTNSQNDLGGSSAFSAIHPGITLRNTNGTTGVTNNINDRIWGTASNSDKLAGNDSSYYATSASPIFTGNAATFTDNGLKFGTKSKFFVESNTNNTVIENTSNETLVFKGAVITSGTDRASKALLKLSGYSMLPGGEANTDYFIGADSVGSRFKAVYAETFSGTATQANTIRVGSTSTYAAATVLTPLTGNNPSAVNSIPVRSKDSTEITAAGITVPAGSIQATMFVGTATAAYYADLAENYLADDEYEVGTVVMVGGEKEVTASHLGARALGVVSEKPAYLMNIGLEGGTPIALKGRVPVKVTGPVNKGDKLVASNDGTAQAAYISTDTFAIALESNSEQGVKLVEAVIL